MRIKLKFREKEYNFILKIPDFVCFPPTVARLYFCSGVFLISFQPQSCRASRLIHITAPPCLSLLLVGLISHHASGRMNGNLVLRLPGITMMEGIWNGLCQAYEILSIHTGSSRHSLTTLMFSIWVWRAELKSTNPLFIVCVRVCCARLCVCKTNKRITWIGFSRWAHCSGVSGGLRLVYDYEVKSRRWRHKQACRNTKVGFFVFVRLFRNTAVKLSSWSGQCAGCAPVSQSKLFPLASSLTLWIRADTHTHTHH